MRKYDTNKYIVHEILWYSNETKFCPKIYCGETMLKTVARRVILVIFLFSLHRSLSLCLSHSFMLYSLSLSLPHRVLLRVASIVCPLQKLFIVTRKVNQRTSYWSAKMQYVDDFNIRQEFRFIGLWDWINCGGKTCAFFCLISELVWTLKS